MQIIMERLPNTLLLMITSEIVVIALALVIDIVSAVKQYSTLDNVLTSFSFVMFSMPIFLMAIGLMYIFAVKFREWGLPYFPTISSPSQAKTLGELAWHMALPLATLTLIGIAGYSRYIRSNMLEVINSDYIRTARAKGLSERTILYVHAFKNAALPLVTLVGLDLPFLLAGAIVTERIFAWPGMGRLFVDHLERLDYAVLMGIIMMITLAVVVFQLLTDLAYTWLDPRIRYS
jgi:peptide/nickel transport system permease protein